MHNKAKVRTLTRDEQRDLDIDISFMEGMAGTDPMNTLVWKTLVDDYYRRKKPKECLRAAEQLAKLLPDDPSVLYDLACTFALNGQQETALPVLSDALEKGFDNFDWLVKDPDLKPVKKHPEYKKIRRKISAFIH